MISVFLHLIVYIKSIHFCQIVVIQNISRIFPALGSLKLLKNKSLEILEFHIHCGKWEAWFYYVLEDSRVIVGNTNNEKMICFMIFFFMIFLAIKASNSPLTKPDIFERRNVNIMEESQKWLVLQYGYRLYYSGKTEEAIQHCQQVK